VQAIPPADGQAPDAEVAEHAEKPADDSPTAQPDDPTTEKPAKPGTADDGPRAPASVPSQWVTLGSLDPATGYRLLVTLTNRGAAIERVELSNPRYQDIIDKTGYLGHLSLEDSEGGLGPRIRVVGPGTPAAQAQVVGSTGTGGLQRDDVIQSVNGTPIAAAADLAELLAKSKPEEVWKIVVDRKGSELTYEVTLARQPLGIIRPEVQAESDPVTGNPLSCVFSLASIGNDRHQLSAGEMGDEIPGIPSLAKGAWEVVQATPEMAEFRLTIPAQALASTKQNADLEVIRRYRLAPAPADKTQDPEHPAYHVEMDVEVRTTSQKGIAVAGVMTGPNNLPLEGWWYTTKISGSWSGCGARDVVMFTDGAGKQLISSQEIMTAAEDPKKRVRALFAAGESEPSRTVRFLGVDAQYFAAVLMPKSDNPQGPLFRSASAISVGDVGAVAKGRNRTLNVSFLLNTESRIVKADDPWVQQYVLFAGPKHTDLLANYGEETPRGRFDLSSLLEYGWFVVGWVARPLSRILHWIEAVVGNYAIAIVLLTVLVRSCMLPISHKAAKNTQKMQLLAPEMKKIAEIYKNDMEKRGRAQQELYRKYDVNPFSGCLLALCQLPIFIGLYRCLSVDIELRQAAIVPGWEWASNLSGPDMFWFWKPFLPLFFVDETGYLGPYFNLLPLITIALFLFNQKMLTPPATDEQTRMQHNIMMVMTVFIGVMFFKVPAGLCIYFISSSIWSLTEHKVLRKNKQPAPSATPPDNADKSKSSPVRRVKK